MRDRVRFLFDDWVGEQSLFKSFPRLFRVVSNRKVRVKECYVCVGNSAS